MGRPLQLCITVFLGTFVNAEWHPSNYVTCEATYGYPSCLLSKGCLLKFLECRCVPAEVKKALLESSTLDGGTLCLYTTYVMQLGEPLCCNTNKRSTETRVQSPLLLSQTHDADQPSVLKRDFKPQRDTPAMYNNQLTEIMSRDKVARSSNGRHIATRKINDMLISSSLINKPKEFSFSTASKFPYFLKCCASNVHDYNEW